MKEVTITSGINTSGEDIVKGKVEKKSGKRIGFNYIIIKSFKESQKNDVVKCLYIKSLSDFGFCVIKEGSYGDTKDKSGRDIIDRLKWQQQLHASLQDKIRMPRLLGHFEERGNYYLVIEHIKGKSLQKLCSDHKRNLRSGLLTGKKPGIIFLDYLIQITELLANLHAQHIVHRDATPNNYMITPSGKVALIDMEMCYSIKEQFPLPAFQLGTYGYMSPQQLITQQPTTAEDIFALGAILFFIFSGTSSGKLTTEPEDTLDSKIQFFIPDLEVAKIVKSCFIHDDTKRPSARDVKLVLEKYKTDLLNKKHRAACSPILYNRNQILESLQKTIHTLTTPLYADEGGGWFADDMEPATGDDKHKLRKKLYASYNRGVSGIMYMLGCAKQAGLNIDPTIPIIQQSLDIINRKYIERPGGGQPGLHFGSDGIAAVLTNLISQHLIEPRDEYLTWINQLLSKNSSVTNYTHGLAGQGIASIICNHLLQSEIINQRLSQIATSLVAKQNEDGSWHSGLYRKKIFRRRVKKINLGFDEGISGIIHFLLEYGHQYHESTAIDAAKRGLKYIISKGKLKKGILEFYTSRGKLLDYGLMKGVSGIAFLMIRAYELIGEDKFKTYAVQILSGIEPKLTDTNLSQANGLCGLGEVYLEAYRAFKDEQWMERANWIGQVVMHMKKQHSKYGTYWLVEHERQPVANFMIGTSGIMHFLIRLCYPDKIGFPLKPNELRSFNPLSLAIGTNSEKPALADQ